MRHRDVESARQALEDWKALRERVVAEGGEQYEKPVLVRFMATNTYEVMDRDIVEDEFYVLRKYQIVRELDAAGADLEQAIRETKGRDTSRQGPQRGTGRHGPQRGSQRHGQRGSQRHTGQQRPERGPRGDSTDRSGRPPRPDRPQGEGQPAQGDRPQGDRPQGDGPRGERSGRRRRRRGPRRGPRPGQSGTGSQGPGPSAPPVAPGA